MNIQLREYFSWLFEIPILSPAFVGIIMFFLSAGSFFFSSSDLDLKLSVLLQFVGLTLGAIFAFGLYGKRSGIRYFNSFPFLLNSFIKSGDKCLFYFIILLLQGIQAIDLGVNSNFLSDYSSDRFTHITHPFLHNLSLYFSPLSTFLLFLAPMRSWKGIFLSPPWIISNILMVVSLTAASSKASLFTFLTRYIVVIGLRFLPQLNISLKSIIGKTVNLRFSKLLLLSLPLIVILVAVSVSYALFSAGDLGALVYRIFNGFDQLSLINASTIDIVSIGDAPVYPLVWFKSFFRPFFPSLYDSRFDNYTEHLIFLLHGKLTLSYSDTGWAPNNLLFVDSILNFPNSLLLQMLNTSLLSFVYVAISLKAFAFFFTTPFFSSIRSAVSLAPTAFFCLSPLAFAQDTQFLFGSLMFLSLFFVLLFLLLPFFSSKVTQEVNSSCSIFSQRHE